MTVRDTTPETGREAAGPETADPEAADPEAAGPEAVDLAAADPTASLAATGVAEELPSGSPVDALTAALGDLPAKQQLPLPRWLAPLAVCCVVGIVPWIVFLAMTLPSQANADDYDIAWVGFDSAMALVLGTLAYCAIRRKPATELIAAVAATMLVVDAWFDVVTSEGRNLMLAILTATFGELPLAIICGWVAVNAERVRARAYRRLRLRWERAVEIVRSSEPT
jgi:hypothetical protein